MKSAGRVALLALLLAGCLRPGNEDEPKGGVDVTLFPSAATKGTPFVTPDGWTITIHRFAIRVAAADVTTAPDGTQTGGGPGIQRKLVPSPECHLRITAAEAGERAAIGLVSGGAYGSSEAMTPELPPCGVDADTLKRFGASSDDSDPAFPSLPSLIVDATATKDGQTLRVSFAAGSFGAYSDPSESAKVTIEANVGAPVSFPIDGELLFAPSDPGGVSFTEIAACDTNGDGTVTGAEMNATPRACVPFGGSGDDDTSSAPCPSVLSDLGGHNVNAIFGPGVTP